MESREEWAARHHCAQTDFEELAWRLQCELESVSLDPVRLRKGKAETIRKAWMAAEKRTMEEMVNPGIPDSPTMDDYIKQELGSPETVIRRALGGG